ncbi:MAG: T9SS type A sorting domain-containing protein [Saprospiraceae bacterium]|nr:T9SS type A sorting domain-containing protein [Saprospiraceae bacterium]MBP6566044.1 T9SS type A sorting domain-containing protein [Saprospiraceae bacterium]
MRIFTKLCCLLMLISIWNQGASQEGRYTKEVFSKVNVSAQLPVQSNFTVMPWVGGLLGGMPGGGSTRQPLRAQFYTPDGDTKTDRPLVIYLHTGNFIPFSFNGSCGGTVRDSTNVEVATRLAKMGYVVAVVEYRQGWLPTIEQELLKRYTLIQGAYRGVQDVNAYVRYFRKSVAELNNPHGINPDKITVWGQGTGGYLSLAAGYLNQYSEITNTPGGKWLLPVQGVGNVPMIIEGQNGTVTGEGASTFSGPQYIPTALLGFKSGDTLCVENHKGYSSEFALTVNMGGALGDTSWITKGETPLISFHVASDAFAPCKTGILRVPTARGPEPVVEVSGSCDVGKIMDRIGNNDIFKTIPANKDPFNAKNVSGALGFYQFNNTPADSGSPWEWTFASQPKPNQQPTDCNTDAASARKYIDTIVGYFAPRACVALGLDCWMVNAKDLTDTKVNLKMAPNPATTEISITVSDETPIKSYAVFDISGRMVRNYNNVNSSVVTLKRETLQNGLYLVKMQFDGGTLTKKVVFE